MNNSIHILQELAETVFGQAQIHDGYLAKPEAQVKSCFSTLFWLCERENSTESKPRLASSLRNSYSLTSLPVSYSICDMTGNG